jgi:uncharacterized membrane protein (DUF485 family)
MQYELINYINKNIKLVQLPLLSLMSPVVVAVDVVAFATSILLAAVDLIDGENTLLDVSFGWVIDLLVLVDAFVVAIVFDTVDNTFDEIERWQSNESQLIISTTVLSEVILLKITYFYSERFN